MVQEGESLVIWQLLAIKDGQTHQAKAKGSDLRAILAQLSRGKMWCHLWLSVAIQNRLRRGGVRGF